MSNHQVDLNSPLPRYYQVYASLKERILGNEFTSGEAIPSERQLATEYGVSRITIVKSLDMLVDDNLIERQHGRGNYVLDRADTIVCTEECRVAFCVPTPSESYVLSTLLGATKVAMRNHIQLQTVHIGYGEEEVEQIRALMNRDFDGLILFSRSTHLNAALYQELTDKHYPFVMIDRFCPEVQTDCAIFDDEAAAFALTERLIQDGHRRIAILLSQESFATSVFDRLRGYQKALEANGIPFNEKWVGRNLYELLGLSPNALEQLETTYADFLDYMHHRAPSALVTVNFYSAEQANADLAQIQMALMQVIIEQGAYDVPYELKIPLATISPRPLTLSLTPVVAHALQSGEALGQEAMRLLIARISRSIADAPQVIKLPMTIQ